ncbi:DUF6401 family natural product biosynthesis protein [Plantactinospora sp. GCM10030261]|uniref:DUF6401 family natural product biosynthesis protein n=1 Tax=Plantactinospora sp. GCM10030261 TaxID=3273420 RepID=UPI00361BE4A4
MTSPDARLTSRKPRRRTHPVLAAMLTTFGSAGLAAAARQPALLAAVDQHAAAVRDRLAPTAGRLDGTLGRPAVRASILAAYAEGVRDSALDLGWRPPASPVRWVEADWVLTRLLAVCALAQEPAPMPPAARRPREAGQGWRPEP